MPAKGQGKGNKAFRKGDETEGGGEGERVEESDKRGSKEC